MTPTNNLHCIKCGAEMPAKLDFEKSLLSVCTNKKCKLLGIPQIGQEKLDDYFNSLEINNDTN